MARIALIGGTGLDAWEGGAAEARPGTPYGEASDSIGVITAGRHEVLFLPRHGRAHRIPPHRVNYRANLHALHALEADAVIAVNAVGGITSRFGPGVLAVPAQVVDYTWGRAHTFSDTEEDPLQHVEFARPFSTDLREALLEAADGAALTLVDGGCVGVMQGPRLETAAEIRRLANDGCDVVGMTSMPEAALARELGLPYASVCVVANWAAGIADEPITMDAIEATLGEAMERVRRLLRAFLDRVPAGWPGKGGE